MLRCSTYRQMASEGMPVTAFSMSLRACNHRRRRTGGVLVLSLWLKVFILAIGLAQPAQAASSDSTSAEQDLLAALHVICTSGGVKVLSDRDGDASDLPSDTSAAKSGLLDCARCCCGPATAARLDFGSWTLVTAYFGDALPISDSVVPTGSVHGQANPRAPPHLILT